MPKERIIIRGRAGRIRITLKDTASGQSEVTGPAVRETPSNLPPPPPDTLLISTRVLQFMELRVESGFRPRQEDWEITYALSGNDPWTPDRVHQLASEAVVAEATSISVTPVIEAMLDHIAQERPDPARLVIQVHTHPEGLSQPSDEDISFFNHATTAIQDRLPGVAVYYAIHSVSSEQVRARENPNLRGLNTVVWSTITREHEVAFYDPMARPKAVQLYG